MLFMGEDAIYLARQSIPRLFISLALIFVCIFAVVLGFYWLVNSIWFFVLLLVLFGLCFTQLGLEYRKSKRLVIGNVGDLSISDLTKAISWLSLFSERKRMFGGPGGDAWVNVSIVADHIGGEFKAKWLSIIQSHKMPMRERNSLVSIFSISLPLFAMIFVLGWVKIESVQIAALGALSVVMIVWMYLISKKLRTDSNLYESEEAMSTAGDMVRELIPWVSSRASRPIRVVLANAKYEHVRAIDSVWGNAIAEIVPDTIGGSRKESSDSILLGQDTSSFLASQRNWRIATVLAHLSAGFVTILMFSSALPEVLLGTPDALDIEGFGLIAILVPFSQYFIYVTMPMMKTFFTGGKVSASDIHTILKRTPKSILPTAQHPDFDEKTDFLMTLSQKQHMRISELEDSMKLWLREESNQPSKRKYFQVEGNIVSLTPKGDELAELVKEKIHPDSAP